MFFDVVLKFSGFGIVPNVVKAVLFNVAKNVAMTHFNITITTQENLVKRRGAGRLDRGIFAGIKIFHVHGGREANS